MHGYQRPCPLKILTKSNRSLERRYYQVVCLGWLLVNGSSEMVIMNKPMRQETVRWSSFTNHCAAHFGETLVKIIWKWRLYKYTNTSMQMHYLIRLHFTHCCILKACKDKPVLRKVDIFWRKGEVIIAFFIIFHVLSSLYSLFNIGRMSSGTATPSVWHAQSHRLSLGRVFVIQQEGEGRLVRLLLTVKEGMGP